MNNADASLNRLARESSSTAEPGCAPAKAYRLPELVAPAGDWDCIKAAVENGADGVYFGLERHNARMRAANFTEAELPRMMEFLHRRGVKGYVTFNTLVFEDELANALEALRAIIAAGVDAVMVQDVGICRLIRRLSPDFPFHASTQMTITSAGGVEFAGELGCSRVVLARECSIKETERIQASLAEARARAATESNRQPATGKLQIPLEVFIHGALCVAYSGQCLTSESLGGRSANRGVCAQACRMPYELISDGQLVPLGDRRYLLSPQDLAGLELVPALVQAGVTAFKIEGRLKTPEYVANITRIYRQAIDALAGEGGRIASDMPSRSSRFPLTQTLSPTEGESARSVGEGVAFTEEMLLHPPSNSQVTRAALSSDSVQYDMEMAFSRGLYTGWLGGLNNQELVHGRFGKKRGVYLGEVSRVQGEQVLLKLQGPLKPGDGVVFDAGHPEQEEEGGRVYEIRNPKSEIRNRETALAFGWGDVDFSRIHVGDKVWKTSDPELDRRLRQTFAGEEPRFQRPVDLELHGTVGEPMRVVARDEQGHSVEITSNTPLVQALKQPLSTERLREQLGRLGGTPFRLGHLENRLKGEVILPVSELNRMRREFVTRLEAQWTTPRSWGLDLRFTIHDLRAELVSQDGARSANSDASVAASPELIVLVRSLPQLEAALQSGVTTLYCDFEEPKKYRDAVRMVRESVSCAGPERTVWVAPPRIFKPGDEWMLKQVRSCDADGYLVRNYDHLRFFADCRCIGDFSLNVANSLSADYFKNRYGLERLTASYDLNAVQLEALLQAAPPDWFEVTIHQHMPMFHMEHCVFCAFLTKGTDYTNCGRPCDKHKVKLRDRVGAEHPVLADVGCRNTVFNGVAQTGAEYVVRLMTLGASHFRVEFVNEAPEQVAQIIAKYRQLLRGETTGAQLWRELKLLNQLGVTRGPIDKS